MARGSTVVTMSDEVGPEGSVQRADPHGSAGDAKAEKRLQPRPGRRVTRRLREPRLVGAPPRHAPGVHARALREAFAAAVRSYGSDCGGYLAFDPLTRSEAGVWAEDAVFPERTVVVPLAWGRISDDLAQQLLEGDAWFDQAGELSPPGP